MARFCSVPCRLLVLLACLSLGPAWAEPAVRVPFRCLGRFDAVDLTALFFSQTPSEVVLLEGEQALRLPQALSADGSRYSDGSSTFWIKGDGASWSRGSAVTMTCKARP